jgi:hypothetical protein
MNLTQKERKTIITFRKVCRLGYRIFTSSYSQCRIGCIDPYPSPMNFISKILNRPQTKTLSFDPVGYPADECWVPDIKRKGLEDICVFIKRIPLSN